MVAAGLLVASGLGCQESINLVSTARGLTTPETLEQVEWIKHLPSGSLVSAP